MVELESVNVCMSPPTVVVEPRPLRVRQTSSPNPLEINSAVKLNEFGNHMSNLQQKIDFIAAKSSLMQPLKTPPPIAETGDVDKDFQTVFEFNDKGNTTPKTIESKEEEEIVVLRNVLSPPPPPLPKSAPPIVREPMRVAPPPPPPPHVLTKQVSVNSLNTLKPWQKQSEYRPMSEVLKDRGVEDPLKSIQFNFKPIGPVSPSSAEIRLERADVLTPLPIYTSKSVENLMDDNTEDNQGTDQVHGSLDNLFPSKSSDDLLMPDIDGIHGIRSSKLKRTRHVIRPSVSHDVLSSSTNDHRDQGDIYENLDKLRNEVNQLKEEAAQIDRKKKEMDFLIRPVVVAAKKPPLPLPRIGSDTEVNRSSKTLSFVFDPKSNEFVLESERVETPMPDVSFLERNSLLLQQRSSSASTLVPINIPSPKRQGFVKSMDSLDTEKTATNDVDTTLNEKGNFFNFRFLMKSDKDKTMKRRPVAKSVFYSEASDLISLDDNKFEAKLVHINDDDGVVEIEKTGQDDDEDDHYELLNVNQQPFNRSLSTFGPQNVSSTRKFGLSLPCL